MSLIDPKLLAKETIAEPDPDLNIPSDPVEQSNLWAELQKIASERPLTAEETQRMVAVTRALRRTNTGPAKAKTPRAKAAKAAISTEDLLGD